MSDFETSKELGYSQPAGYQGADAATSANDRRRAALAEIDEAKFSWFHAKACLVAGVGFFTDAYDSELITGQTVYQASAADPQSSPSPSVPP